MEGGADSDNLGREFNTEQAMQDKSRIRHSSSLAQGSIKNLGNDIVLNDEAGPRGRNLLLTAGQVMASDGNGMSKVDASSNYGGVSSI